MRLVGLACVSLLALPSAWGQRPKVAILDVSVAGDAPAEIRGKMEKSLAGGLFAAGYEVVRREEVRRKLRSARELEGCTTPTCLAKVQGLVGADQFVRGRVETEGASFTVALELYAVEAAGGLVRRQERSCAPCTLAEANELMSELAATIFVEPKPKKVALAVDSSPPGAAIRVDGGGVGIAPVTVELEPGEHTVRADLAGRTAGEEKVKLDPAAPPRRLVLTLAPAVPPPPPPPPEAPPGRYGAWKWVTAGGAAAAVAGGVALIAINGSLTDCPAVGTCRSKYDTILPGLALAGAGLALGGLTIYFIVNDKPATAAAVVPVPGGAAAMVRGRF
ncbi:MAG TPA: PEGA domain-containing protein [Haliangiales bacterium]|nr:PEGA domain-containing protein [Haliangiales bacterium]